MLHCIIHALSLACMDYYNIMCRLINWSIPATNWSVPYSTPLKTTMQQCTHMNRTTFLSFIQKVRWGRQTPQCYPLDFLAVVLRCVCVRCNVFMCKFSFCKHLCSHKTVFSLQFVAIYNTVASVLLIRISRLLSIITSLALPFLFVLPTFSAQCHTRANSP
jgi:hypothetical protein